MVSTDIGPEIRRFILGIREWVRAGVILYPEVRDIFGRVLQADECLEFHQFALQAKINQGQTVAKHVVDPSDFSRFGNDLKTAIQQSLIEAVSRAK